MRVLVTGGAGFIGSHVVEQALASGFEVAVLDNFSSGKPSNVPRGVRVFAADLRDRVATFRAVQEFAPALVSHHAAQASVPLSMKDPSFDAQINIVGGVHLLDACTAAGSRARRVVFASTGGAIYGEVPDGERAAESFRRQPQSPYGAHKLAFEGVLDHYRERFGLSIDVLRYANVYGPRQSAQGEAGVVAIFFERARAGRKLSICAKRVPGDGGCVRDYVYVRDVARANVQALTGKLPYSLTNVGSGRATTTHQLARRILQLTGSRSKLEQRPRRAGDVERSLLDPTRFERSVGSPTPLDVGLRETARWYGAD